VQWGMRALMRGGPLNGALRKTVYTSAAVVPEMPWLERTRPREPELHVEAHGSGLQAVWVAAPGQNIRWSVIQTRKNGNWKTEVLPSQNGSVLLPLAGLEVIALSSLDRFGMLSPPSVLGREK